MESVDENGGSRLVVTELGHIKELVRQLDVNLGGCPEHCKRLAAQIFDVTERSIGMIMSGHFDCPKRSAAGLDSPPFSATPSPLSDVSGMPFHTNNKKRKIMEKRKHQVRVSSEVGGAETPVDDGHSWRKYGQKDILGAKHPRGYYRCTHRKSQGCAATKQVQRADEDPTLFDVIYHGEHTCVHKTVAALAAGHAEENPGASRLLQNLSTSLTVNTEGLTATAGHQGCSTTTSFCFSSQAARVLAPQEHYPFSMPSTPENCFGQGASLSTSLEPSPVTSDSNRFSMTPFQAEWRARSELDEVVSALVAAGAPAMEETPFSLDGFEFDVSGFFA
ncbi:putative WRKY transcription factor 41 [Hordeum vulgare]|nr:putative WRKY transcription factor 41 [Hordeum vulgare]